MELRQIIQKLPDSFKYKAKLYTMIHYSREATHNGMISDLIVWRNNVGEEIVYDKGRIYAP